MAKTKKLKCEPADSVNSQPLSGSCLIKLCGPQADEPGPSRENFQQTDSELFSSECPGFVRENPDRKQMKTKQLEEPGFVWEYPSLFVPPPPPPPDFSEIFNCFHSIQRNETPFKEISKALPIL